MLKEKHLIFKITLTATILSLAVALSVLEVQIPLQSFGIPATTPMEFGDILILVGLPMIGPWFAIMIGISKPWLHMLVTGHDHGGVVGNVLSGMTITFVIALYFSLMFCWKILFKKENVYFKLFTILICSIAVALFVAINIHTWATKALGFTVPNHSCSSHNHDHSHDFNYDSFLGGPLDSRLKIIYGVYGGLIFLKYLVTFLLFLLIEKPILKYAEHAHYSYHNWESEFINKRKNNRSKKQLLDPSTKKLWWQRKKKDDNNIKKTDD